MFLQNAYSILESAGFAGKLFNKTAVTIKNSLTPKRIADYAKEVRGINNANRLSYHDSPFMADAFKKATLGPDDRKQFIDSVSELNKDRKTMISHKLNKAKEIGKKIAGNIGGGVVGGGGVMGAKIAYDKTHEKPKEIKKEEV